MGALQAPNGETSVGGFWKCSMTSASDRPPAIGPRRGTIWGAQSVVLNRAVPIPAYPA
jgi:hypothetical protein